MSDVRERPAKPGPQDTTEVASRPDRPAAVAHERRALHLPSAKWLVTCTLGWIVVALIGVVVVVFAVGPLLQARHQRVLLGQLATSVDQSVGAVNDSLFGVAAPTAPPALGSPVALLEIGALGVQLAVAEGADSSTTQGGPGHVPGTAGPGQAGNSVVVARRSGFGGAFGNLIQLDTGNEIVVTTTQGRSKYTVSSVNAGPLDDKVVYGPTKDNRLTLVTSSTDDVLNQSSATVVTATLDTAPFVPSPQGSRTSVEDGVSPDGGQWPLLALLTLGLVLAAAGSSVLYRRWSPVATYAVTTPVLVSIVVFTSLVAARLLPAWV